MLKDLFFLVALVLIACVDYSWGACWTSSYSVGASLSSGQMCCNDGCGSCNGYGHSGWPFCSEYSSNCPSVYTIPTNGRKVTGLVSVGSNASGCLPGDGLSCNYNTICDTQAEADSVACLNSGKLWLDGACKDEQDICEDSGEFGKVIRARYAMKQSPCLMNAGSFGTLAIISRVTGVRLFSRSHIMSVTELIVMKNCRMFRK